MSREDEDHSEEEVEMEDSILSKLLPWMENITSLIKSGFEKHLNILQSEVYTLKINLDNEREKTSHLQKQNATLQTQLNILHGDFKNLEEKVDKLDQEKISNDIVIENLDKKEVSDPRKHLQEVINSTLMGQVVTDQDIIKASIFSNKRDPAKMTMIGKLKDESIKKAILTQKKMFFAKKYMLKKI